MKMQDIYHNELHKFINLIYIKKFKLNIANFKNVKFYYVSCGLRITQ
jgi:hypothetical protein